ncbi:protein of unknown function (DU1801) [Epibacterium ulvae]|uniref:YdhG-like domain-containing protein n=1 Tax=Epibacterium ulvae TaxID=1156985 RepID=A0A1G5PX24_9RHOB|nr:DUF1801 domain-containing protein [Epibacterium ulvae]SCZ54215.1 protein of unknown function (DU1801) [Epibacterium ulvae]
MPTVDPPFQTTPVAAAFEAFAPDQQQILLQIRALIFATAAQLPEVGAIDETLKWGQPSYVPKKRNTGTPLRLGCPKSGGVAVYTHCQTTVIPQFRDLFPDHFQYDGTRAVHLATTQAVPNEQLEFLIRSALRYHLG